MPLTTHDTLIDRLLAAYERDGVMPRIAGGDHDDEGDPPNPDPADPPTPDDDDDELDDPGKWQELAEQREAELTKATTDLEAATGELDALRGYFDAEYTAAVKALPDVIRAFQPEDDADFATKSAWLTTAKEQAAALEKQTSRGNGPGPKPGAGKLEVTSPIDVDATW